MKIPTKWFLKEWFEKYEQYKVTEDPINWMIKGKTDKDTSNKGEIDDVREDRVLHAEWLAALETALILHKTTKSGNPNWCSAPEKMCDFVV